MLVIYICPKRMLNVLLRSSACHKMNGSPRRVEALLVGTEIRVKVGVSLKLRWLRL